MMNPLRSEPIHLSISNNWQKQIGSLGREIVVGNPIAGEESIKSIADEAEKQIQQLIYEFVYDLGSSAIDYEIGDQISYYYDILSRDNKFMKVVKKYMKIDSKALKEATENLQIKIRQ